MDKRRSSILMSNADGGGQVVRLVVYFALLVALTLLRITAEAG